MRTSICKGCKRAFPEHLVQNMVSDRGSMMRCPICALKIRNMHHGLPPDAPFTGSTAAAMYEEAVEWLKKTS